MYRGVWAIDTMENKVHWTELHAYELAADIARERLNIGDSEISEKIHGTQTSNALLPFKLLS